MSATELVLKVNEILWIDDKWSIHKINYGGRTVFRSGFGDTEQQAICGDIFFSKFQIKKDILKILKGN